MARPSSKGIILGVIRAALRVPENMSGIQHSGSKPHCAARKNRHPGFRTEVGLMGDPSISVSPLDVSRSEQGNCLVYSFESGSVAKAFIRSNIRGRRVPNVHGRFKTSPIQGQ